MAVQPLSPATDRRLGRPLPYQLSNQTRAHLCAINLWHHDHAITMRHAVLAFVSKRYPTPKGRLLTRYSPVRHSVDQTLPEGLIITTPFDLNVLCTPPAFILSQDQTLEIIVLNHPKGCFNLFCFRVLLLASFTFFKSSNFLLKEFPRSVAHALYP